MIIFIIGSKPNPTFPNCKPDIAIGVNGAISYSKEKKFEADEFWGVLSGSSIIGWEERTETTVKAIEDSIVDELIFWYDLNKKVPPLEKYLQYSKFIELDLEVRSQLVNSFIPNNKKFFSIFSGLIKRPRSTLIELYNKDFYHGLKPSSGLLAAWYAISRFPQFKKIYLIGIGLDPDSGHFYDGQSRPYGEWHIKADRILYNSLINLYGDKVVGTDFPKKI